MSQAFTSITPVNVSPGVQGSYQDVDCSAHIPAGATGVVLRIHINSGVNQNVYVRKNGSTDDYYHAAWKSGMFWTAVGVDANSVFEAKIESTGVVLIYLVGYTRDEVTFFTNGIDKTPGATGSWQDVDCSANAPNALALLFHRYADSTIISLRKNGSTDNRLGDVYYNSGVGAIIGCDGNQICECYAETGNADLILIGYAVGGVEMNTNAEDVSLSTTTTWTDILIHTNARMAFIEVYATGALEYGLRENGDSGDVHKDAYAAPYGMVGCDVNGYIEGYIETTAVDFYVVGYGAPSILYSYLFGKPEMVEQRNNYLFCDPIIQVRLKKYLYGYPEIVLGRSKYLFSATEMVRGRANYFYSTTTVVSRKPKPIYGRTYQRLSVVEKEVS